jgi:hypothetical protein
MLEKHCLGRPGSISRLGDFHLRSVLRSFLLSGPIA